MRRKFLSENVKGINIFDDLSVDERRILKWVLKVRWDSVNTVMTN
jgi:hypothetical protein